MKKVFFVVVLLFLLFTASQRANAQVHVNVNFGMGVPFRVIRPMPVVVYGNPCPREVVVLRNRPRCYREEVRVYRDRDDDDRYAYEDRRFERRNTTRGWRNRY